MATTDRGVPYPDRTARPDVQSDLKKLAQWVDQNVPTAGGLVPDPEHPGYFIAPSRLAPDPAHPGFYLNGA